jgi:hypothetical protein
MKRRGKTHPRKRPEEGSPEWLRELAGAIEAGIMAAEHDARPLSEAVRTLKASATWHELVPNEPRTWPRLIVERIDPRHGRIEWIEAVANGYEKLRAEGHRGRITRRAAEQAIGYRHPHAARLPQRVPAPHDAGTHNGQSSLEPIGTHHES